MRRAVCIGLYIITLYYLLPFRPLQMLHSSLEKSQQHTDYSYSDLQHQKFKHLVDYVKTNKDVFPKKPRLKFFMDSFCLEEPLKNEIAHFVIRQLHFHSIADDILHLHQFKSGRAPPIA